MLRIKNLSVEVFHELPYGELTQRISSILTFIHESTADIVVFPYGTIVSDQEQEKVVEPQFLLALHDLHRQMVESSREKVVLWSSFHGDEQRQLLASYDGQLFVCGLQESLSIMYQGRSVSLSFRAVVAESDLNIVLENKNYYQKLQWVVLHPHVCVVNNYEVQVTNTGIYAFLGEIVTDQTWGYTLLGKSYSEYSLLPILIFVLHYYHYQYLQGQFAWVIGISGGIDSAISAYLLSQVVPKEQIFAYNLASMYNRTVTKDNAHFLAERLGISLVEYSLQSLVEATVDTVGHPLTDLGLQNVQARLRGHLLSTMAAHHQAVIINNGNKIEALVGYATMYGDMVGSLTCLGDLTKRDIIALAREINSEQVIIPTNLLPSVDDLSSWVMPPSAELTTDQWDPMKWYYYDYIVLYSSPRYNLLSLMRDYYYHQLPSEIERYLREYHLDDPQLFVADLQFLLNSYRRNRFKHRYYPPAIIVSEHPLSHYQYFFANFDDAQFEYWRQQICTKSKY